ncbi:hypothetical protein [Paenibacillus pectinilyticus]|nr:hypothetical protein [Paenibacillus pectinilyticus]
MIAALTFVISGCGSAKTTTSEAKSYTPTLEVTAVVKDDIATLNMTTDLKISKEHYDQQKVQGEGHIHISIDQGEKIVVTDKQYVTEHLNKGTHEVKVSLHNNDHTPYNVSKTISVEVK